MGAGRWEFPSLRAQGLSKRYRVVLGGVKVLGCVAGTLTLQSKLTGEGTRQGLFRSQSPRHKGLHGAAALGAVGPRVM